MTVSSNDGDDYISVSGSGSHNITVEAGNGNDRLSNSNAHDVILNGGAGDNSFYNSGGTDVTMNGGDGNDRFKNEGPNVTINGGAGDDYVDNSGNTAGLNGYTEINAGAGNDTILNTGDHVTINAGTGNDYIYARTPDGTIFKYNAGDGIDTIGGFQSNDTLIIGGASYSTTTSGDHLIVGVGDGAIVLKDVAGITPIIQGTFDSSASVTVPDIQNGGSTNSNVQGFTVSSGKDDTLIAGSDGNDTIKSTGSRVTIRASEGNDSIFSGTINGGGVNSDVNISGGNGSDSIFSNSKENVTIDGGSGDDSIKSYGNNAIISGGDGKDTISSPHSSNVTIDGGTGDDNIVSGSNSSYDTVKGSNILLNGGDGNDSIRNFDNNVTINGGDGKDYISSSYNTSNIVMNGGAGADEIHSSGTNVTIDGGDGYDTIHSSGDNAMISGGDGNDSIRNDGKEQITISGGKGDDIINNYRGYEASVVYEYNVGDGNDTIYNFSPNDTLKIGGASYTTLDNKSYYGSMQLTVKVGEGSIWFAYDRDHPPIIQGTYDTTPAETPASNTGDTTPAETPASNTSDTTPAETPASNTGDTTPAETPASNTVDTTPAETPASSTVDTTPAETPASITGDTGTSTNKISDVLGGGSNTTNSINIGDGSVINGDVVINNYYDNSVVNNNFNTFVYQSGEDTLNNFNSNDKLNFAAAYTGWATDGNDFVLNAAEGSVRIAQAKDKLIEVADANGNLLAHVYFSDSYAGAIDGRGFNAFEVIIGSDHVSNQIWADTSGSSLWGGRGASDDDLFGNLGVDEYIYSYGNGHDNISQSGSEDTLNLLNVNLEQIAGAVLTDDGSYLQFTDGGSLNVSGKVGTFVVSGQSYQANYETKSWTTK